MFLYVVDKFTSQSKTKLRYGQTMKTSFIDRTKCKKSTKERIDTESKRTRDQRHRKLKILSIFFLRVLQSMFKFEQIIQNLVLKTKSSQTEL